MEKRTKLTVIAIFFALSLVIPGMSLAADPGDVQIHGFVSQGYLYTGTNEFLADTKAGSFEFNEVGVNFTAEPVDRLRIGVQLFSRDMGDIDNNRIDLDWAFAEYRFLNEFGIRVGRIKSPNGLNMDSIDLDMTRTSIFLPFSCYEPRFRALLFSGNGIGVYGTINLGPVGGLDYSGTIGTNSITTGALDKQYESFMDPESVKVRLAYGGRLIWNAPFKGFLIGGSYYIAENIISTGTLLPAMTAPIPQLGGLSLYPAGTKITLNANKATSYYLFTQLALQKLTLTAEYNRINVEADIKTDQPYDPLVASLVGFKGFKFEDEQTEGWYAQADYQFLDWLTAAATYSEYYFDADDRQGDNSDPNQIGYQKDATVSLRFDINSHWNIKLETHFITGTALVVIADRVNVPDDLEKNWNLYAVKTSFYF